MVRRCSILLLGVLVLTSAGHSKVPSEVTIKEWDVPTANSRPHDPAVAPDGALWYTGQTANKLGRLDPKTGQIREYPLRTPNSGPHGLVADAEGNIWYTGNSAAHIGKLDPATGEVTEYPMPDARARDPHTPVFDAKGILWFTVQGGNFVGRLDPRAGSVTLKESPTPGSRPYGIVTDSTGVPYFCENGTNKIGRIDPETLQITEYLLPQTARPRRLAITPDDIIYYADDRGTIGRLDPRTGVVEATLSPSGSGAAPYAITATGDGVVWYCETGVQPNRVVRFDPSSKSFASWPIPSGGGVVRHMVATPERNLYIACSGVNKVGIVYPSNEQAFSIADRGAVVWTTPGAISPAVTGYARVVPDDSSATPAGVAIIALRQNGGTVTEAAVPASPLLRNGRIHAQVSGNVRTGLAIANRAAEAASLSFYFTSAAGGDTVPRSETLAAGAQISAFLDQSPYGGAGSIDGTFTFTSTVPVAAVALRGTTNERSEFLITPLPVVDLASGPEESLLFPHFADGGGWTTEILLVNPTDTASSGSLQFFSQGSATESGQPLTLTVDGKVASSFSYSLAPRGSQRFETAGTAAGLRVGSARVLSGAGATPWGSAVVTYRREGVTVSAASVLPVRAGTAFRLYAESSTGAESVQTGIAIANPSAAPVAVNLELTALDGSSTGRTGKVTIAGQGQTAVFLNQISGLGPSSLPFQGVLRIATAASSGVVVAGIRGRTTERGDFLIASIQPMEESASRTSAEMLFPQLVDGGGYTTQFILLGASPGATTSGVLRFFSPSGVSLGMDLR